MVREGKEKGRKVVGAANVEQKRGFLNPDNAAAVREGRAKGAKNSAKARQKCSCEKPTCGICGPRIRKRKSHAVKKAREEEEQEEEEEQAE